MLKKSQVMTTEVCLTLPTQGKICLRIKITTESQWKKFCDVLNKREAYDRKCFQHCGNAFINLIKFIHHNEAKSFVS
ncbi:CLUMA_CG010410, isoform A [Clunio marinus]|uniref:CLUMA_CG010410, isoform A n=1 Tax=Clunio marinus TaxID=568069 RepID=A0A1J1I9G8_9DIPT|nr:CLUMA_CG010410, isoform A [Clunio marinus]